jgi:hypothetical protein
MTHAHDELFERITAYLDGDLSAEERTAFEAELETNDELRELLLAATEAMDVVSRAPAPKPPEDFDHDVARVIRRRSRGRFFGSWTHAHYQGSWLFALISLAFLGAWMFLATPERMDALLGPGAGSGSGAAPEEEWQMEFPAQPGVGEGSQAAGVPLPDVRGAEEIPVQPDAGPGESGSEGSAPGVGVGSQTRRANNVDLSRAMAQPRLQGWVYTIETPLGGAELRTELVNRVGSERLEETANGFRIRLGLDEQVQMAARLQELGVVRREAQLADSTSAPTWLEVVSTQR